MLDEAKLFAGGEDFSALFAATLHITPVSKNVTSDATTGLGGWTVTDIVTVLKQGKAKDGTGICPPMPVGPMGAFGGLTDADTTDIANYIKSLPPISNAVTDMCVFPPTGGGGGAGGGAGGAGGGGRAVRAVRAARAAPAERAARQVARAARAPAAAARPAAPERVERAAPPRGSRPGVSSQDLDARPGWVCLALLAALGGCGSGSAASEARTRSRSDASDRCARIRRARTRTRPNRIHPAPMRPAPDSNPVPPPPGPYPRPTYATLSETGLFADAATKRIAEDALPFEPTYWLWSDGADKRRWLRLPPGTRIDTTAMDHWVFPIGTKLWKEFSLGGVLLETRLIERYGDGPEDYWMGAFVWNAEQTDAVLAPDGQTDINGTPHDAPAQKDCLACHRGDTGRVLGFSAMQLSRADGRQRASDRR